MLRGNPFQTVGAKRLNDLLPDLVENCGTSRKRYFVKHRVSK